MKRSSNMILSFFLAIIITFDLIPSNLSMLSVVAASNEEIIYSYLTNVMGFNTAAACGTLANIYEESRFNPNLGEAGTSNGGYGICQWTGSRKNDLITYCNNNGLNVSSLESQLKFFEYEIKKSYKGVYNYLSGVPNTASGAWDAASYYCMNFEKPYYRDKVRGQYNANGVPTVNGGYDYFPMYDPRYQIAKTPTGAIGYTECEYRGNNARDIYWVKYSGQPVEPKITCSGINYPSNPHTPGKNFGIEGTIKSNNILDRVWGGVYNADGTKAQYYDYNPNSTTVNLHGVFNNNIIFDNLPVGSYVYKIEARDVTGYSRELFTPYSFNVGNPSITVSFNANGGSVSPTSKTYQIGGKYSDLPTPSRKGYIFDGWYSTASGGTKVSNGSALISSSGHTLYAHWKDDMRKIYFNANGGICSTEYITRRYGGGTGDAGRCHRT